MGADRNVGWLRAFQRHASSRAAVSPVRDVRALWVPCRGSIAALGVANTDPRHCRRRADADDAGRPGIRRTVSCESLPEGCRRLLDGGVSGSASDRSMPLVVGPASVDCPGACVTPPRLLYY